jgi:hypothetical protein
LEAGSSTSDRTVIGFDNADKLEFFNTVGGTVSILTTTQVFRDASAWYHIVVAMDTTQATASNRTKVYVNGVEVTSFSTANYVSQNADTSVNAAIIHRLGANQANGDLLNGYMTEVNFIDGQALTPSSFGEFNADTGVWQPKRYAGSYGTNGFYLNFSNNSNTTAATLGADYSGNGNNWTPNNFSVSAGSGNDSLVDVPTNWGVDTGVGGSVRGNYATLLPTYGSTGTFSNGNLDLTTASSNNAAVPTGFFPNSSKWYWEVLITAIGNSNNASIRVGVCNPNGVASGLGEGLNGWSFLGDGRVFYNSSASSYGVSVTTGDTVMVALDIDAGRIWYGKNGTWMASGDPATNANPSQTFTANQSMSPALASGTGTPAYTCNFGQRPFAYTAPSGFKALNTQNLPTPTIGATPATQAGKFFNPVIWTGNDALSRTITGVGFQPDLNWTKQRSGGIWHGLIDAVRGTGKTLYSNATNAEVTNDSVGYISAFTSDGFTATQGSAGIAAYNTNNATYVAWNWKANGTGVTNTAGSITSTVSANTTSGFSVVTFTTQSSGTATVGHGLGAAPRMIITKSRAATGNWATYHASLGNGQVIYLDVTNAAATSGAPWNNTSPSSTVFTLGTGFAAIGTMVAYCFSEISGFSRAFSYTGNGSTDGPFVFCGFRPAYVMIKRTDAVSSWEIHDTKRAPFNADDKNLYANLQDAEATYVVLDELSNGFKMRGTLNGTNQSGGTYVGIAFAESPFKYSLAR